MPPFDGAAPTGTITISFNPSKEMTAVPPNDVQVIDPDSQMFQPLKGNDGRAAIFSLITKRRIFWFQPLKGNDGRAAKALSTTLVLKLPVSTPQRK